MLVKMQIPGTVPTDSDSIHLWWKADQCMDHTAG